MLEKGDVIELVNGQNIYATMEGRFFGYSEAVHGDIEIGRVYEQKVPLEKEDEGYIENYLEKEYEKQQAPGYMGSRGVIGTQTKVIDKFDSSIFSGKYLVLYTTCDGGGIQGTFSGYDSYPSGHHVFCKKIVDGKVSGPEVDFYETGCFSAMITDLKPIDHVEIGYEIEPLNSFPTKIVIGLIAFLGQTITCGFIAGFNLLVGYCLCLALTFVIFELKE